MNLGDNDFTLKPACHEIIEAEANYAAGELLFLQERYISDARDSARSLKTVQQLARRYGNTVTSTLWRYVEGALTDVAALGVISVHPKHLPDEFDPANSCRYFIQSSRFRGQFSNVSERQVFLQIAGYCGYQKGGPLGDAEVVLAGAPRIRCR